MGFSRTNVHLVCFLLVCGRAVQLSSRLFLSSLALRVKATILYATETGRSATFAKRVNELFSYNFNSHVRQSMHVPVLTHTFVLPVFSTFLRSVQLFVRIMFMCLLWFLFRFSVLVWVLGLDFTVSCLVLPSHFIWIEIVTKTNNIMSSFVSPGVWQFLSVNSASRSTVQPTSILAFKR